jgi:gamma-glutamyltranspeptidase/glutathione hydrolase
MQNNQFVAALATPGGSTIPTQIVLAIENLLDYQMSISAAIRALRFHMQWLPDILYKEPFAVSLLNSFKLHQMDYQQKLGSPYGSLFWGSMVGISKDNKSLQFSGVAQ